MRLRMRMRAMEVALLRILSTNKLNRCYVCPLVYILPSAQLDIRCIPAAMTSVLCSLELGAGISRGWGTQRVFSQKDE